MTEKEKRIKAAYEALIRALQTGDPASAYDMAVCTEKTLRLLSGLYEAGYVAGELSKIKEN